MNSKSTRSTVFIACLCSSLVALMITLIVPSRLRAADELPVYLDSLAGEWSNWSWGGVNGDFANGNPVHGGSHSIAVTFSGGWSGLQFGSPTGVDVGGLDTLRFWVHGGSAGGQVVEFQVGNSCATAKLVIAPAAGIWMLVEVPLADLGKPTRISSMYWFNPTSGAQPTFYLDDIAFISKGTPPPAPVAGPALSIDVRAGRHPISPFIYGMSFATEDLAEELKLPLRRWGGNATTRYNWQNDTANHASDWFFENIAEDNDPTNLPDGSETDLFVEQDRRTGTMTLLTVPLIGWTPKDRSPSCGYSVIKYGPQQATDPWRPDCGNGVRLDGSEITGNDPHDTSSEITPAFVQEWMSHLAGRYGTAANGGVKLYNLDNEPMLWNDTHRDVHPDATSYDEIRDLAYLYAAAIKATDPSAQTCGPAVWGWTAYYWSALDWEPGGAWWSHPQDRLAHGDVPFIEWYLRQMRAYEQSHGTRILDFLDVHYYPQGDGIFSESAGHGATQALRLRSTRALWDSTYKDESWINEPVFLIPRMRQWVADNYPGTGTYVGEYSWGGLCHMNGALAQADVLGIFGREGLDMATLWGPPASDQPGAFAFRMYLNFDGLGSKFGDISVRAASASQDQLSVYAAQRRTDGALTMMVINKTRLPLISPVAISGHNRSGAAKVYRYDTDDLTQIVRQPDQPVSSGGFTATFPPSSITLILIPRVTPMPYIPLLLDE